MLTWLTDGVPEDVHIPGEAIHGALSWATEGTVYAGHYRHMFLSGFNSENWTIVLARGEKTILQPLVEFQKTLGLLLVLVFAFVLLLSAAGIRQNLGPLAKLMEATRRLAAQDFSARVLITSGDEFEELAGSFNNMTEKVGTLVEELKRSQLEHDHDARAYHRREVSLDGGTLRTGVSDVRGDRTCYGARRG